MALSEGGERLAAIVRNNDTARSQVPHYSANGHHNPSVNPGPVQTPIPFVPHSR